MPYIDEKTGEAFYFGSGYVNQRRKERKNKRDLYISTLILLIFMLLLVGYAFKEDRETEKAIEISLKSNFYGASVRKINMFKYRIVYSKDSIFKVKYKKDGTFIKAKLNKK